jgi:hypothetical protein
VNFSRKHIAGRKSAAAASDMLNGLSIKTRASAACLAGVMKLWLWRCEQKTQTRKVHRRRFIKFPIARDSIYIVQHIFPEK